MRRVGSIYCNPSANSAIGRGGKESKQKRVLSTSGCRFASTPHRSPIGMSSPLPLNGFPSNESQPPTCTALDDLTTPSFLMVPHTRNEPTKQTISVTVSFVTTKSGGEASTPIESQLLNSFASQTAPHGGPPVGAEHKMLTSLRCPRRHRITRELNTSGLALSQAGIAEHERSTLHPNVSTFTVKYVAVQGAPGADLNHTQRALAVVVDNS